MGVQGAKPPAGARGVPALSLFPKKLGDDALDVDLQKDANSWQEKHSYTMNSSFVL